MLLLPALTFAFACSHPLRDTLAHHERGLDLVSVELDPGDRLPPPAPRVLVGPDAIVVDALAWEVQPAFADAGMGAELDAVARHVAEPIPLVEGRVPDEHLRGWLISRLYEAMMDLHEADWEVEEATGKDRHRTGRLRVVVDEGLPAGTLTRVLYSAGQGMHSEATLELDGPRGRTGLDLQFPGIGGRVEGPRLQVDEDGVQLTATDGEVRRWPCHQPGCTPVEGARGLDRFVHAAGVDAALAALSWPEPTPPTPHPDAPLAHLLALTPSMILVATADEAPVALLVEVLARADRRIEQEDGVMVVVGSQAGQL